jgi:hypothetical protein
VRWPFCVGLKSFALVGVTRPALAGPPHRPFEEEATQKKKEKQNNFYNKINVEILFPHNETYQKHNP